jgi:NADH-quinone oxidoreductase subunit M
LIVTFANLAMPGSSNFIGEFMILLGVFSTQMWIAIVATLGVVGAAVYALRLFITAMHNRVGGRVKSFEVRRIEVIAIVPLIALILVLGFYPQFGLNKSQASVKAAIAPAASSRGWWAYPPLASVSYSPSKTTTTK